MIHAALYLEVVMRLTLSNGDLLLGLILISDNSQSHSYVSDMSLSDLSRPCNVSCPISRHGFATAEQSPALNAVSGEGSGRDEREMNQMFLN